MDGSMPGFPVFHSWSFFRFMSIELGMLSNHLILCQPLPLSFAFNLSQLQVFSNELALLIRWSKYWNFSFFLSPSNEYSGLISFRIWNIWMLLLLLSRISRVRLCVIPQTAAHQAPPALGFSRQEHWSGEIYE